MLASPRLFDFAQAALLNAAVFDMTLTASGVRHPPILHLTVTGGGATRFVNIDDSNRFAEGGWARVFSRHNAPVLIAAYAGEDLALTLLVRHFVARHPRWRLLGTIALLTQTWIHIESGRTWIGLGNRLAAPYAAFDPVWIR